MSGNLGGKLTYLYYTKDIDLSFIGEKKRRNYPKREQVKRSDHAIHKRGNLCCEIKTMINETERKV